MARRKNLLKIPEVRCDTSAAIALMDMKGGNAEIQQMIKRDFVTDAAERGQPSTEFLYGYVSAIVFVQQWLMNRGAPDRSIAIVADAGTVVARRYLDAIEKQVEAKVRM